VINSAAVSASESLNAGRILMTVAMAYSTNKIVFTEGRESYIVKSFYITTILLGTALTIHRALFI
jgi:hypothetical protein